jgi:hypothetical protein
MGGLEYEGLLLGQVYWLAQIIRRTGKPTLKLFHADHLSFTSSSQRHLNTFEEDGLASPFPITGTSHAWPTMQG